MMFACLYLSPRWPGRRAHPDAARALLALAHEHSPRVESQRDGLVVVDVDGLERLWGPPRDVGERLRRVAAERGLGVRVAVARTKMAAVLATHGRCGLTVIPSGAEAKTLSSFPIAVLITAGVLAAAGPELLPVVRRWGLKTLGELAALPADELFTRLGPGGAELQRIARGQDDQPFVPDPGEERFEHTVVLEWPVEGLEPLAFVLGRVLEPLSRQLVARGVAVGMLKVRLTLVTQEMHERTLRFPAPVRDPKVLRTLILLDLESHPPSAGVDVVTVLADPVPARTLQGSLLERAIPSAERVSTLLARLTVLMGEQRCGSPGLVDTHEPGAFQLRPFSPKPQRAQDPTSAPSGMAPNALVHVLRRFRVPVPVRVHVDRGRPVRVSTGHRRPRTSGFEGNQVVTCAGPWRTSGQWWGTSRAAFPWDRDEWDVALKDGGLYRIFQDRVTRQWFVEGVVD